MIFKPLTGLATSAQIGIMAGALALAGAAGAKVQHWREAGKRTALQDEIADLLRHKAASEGARAEQAVQYAASLERLSTASGERWAGIADYIARQDAGFQTFMTERSHETDDDCSCRIDDDSRARWVRLQSAAQDGVRDEDDGRGAGDEPG